MAKGCDPVQSRLKGIVGSEVKTLYIGKGVRPVQSRLNGIVKFNGEYEDIS